MGGEHSRHGATSGTPNITEVANFDFRDFGKQKEEEESGKEGSEEGVVNVVDFSNFAGRELDSWNNENWGGNRDSQIENSKENKEIPRGRS